MSEAKRHHYVPRVYLDQFTSSSGNLSVIEKPTGRTFPASPNNAAVISHHNTVELLDGSKDQSTLEDFFQQIETDYLKFLDSVRSEEISGETIDFFVTLAIHQRMRTPRIRRQIADLFLSLDSSNLLEPFKKTFSTHEIDLLDRAKRSEKNARNQLGIAISGHFAITTGLLLQGMGFAFLFNTSSVGFISSDNPATLSGISSTRGKLSATLPFPSKRRVLVFPISRDVLLYGDTDLRSGCGFITFRNGKEVSRTTARRVNNLTSISADRYIFLPEEGADPLPSVSIRNRLDEESQNIRVFKGQYSKSLIDTIRSLRAMVN